MLPVEFRRRQDWNYRNQRDRKNHIFKYSGQEKEETDEGSVVRQNGIRLAYLTQHPEYAKEDTVFSFACKDTDESDWQAMQVR